MITVDDRGTERLTQILERLGTMSVEDYYNPYRMFDWPESLPEDELWMSRDLLTVHGTAQGEELTEEQLITLSRWESVNFYSLNVHGIRELLMEVVNRVHMPGFEIPSEFFHHFIGEENEHMWFFAEFCKRYGRKIYPFPRLKTKVVADADLENFLVFSRILMFEEIVDYYNMRMAADETLHETIRQVNRIHHQDESRHIAFGRELVTLLFNRVRDRLDAGEIAQLSGYLREYRDFCVHSMYSLQAYEDAGIADPVAFRSALITSPERRKLDDRACRKPVAFFTKLGVFAAVGDAA
ncbi:diiron oxygenase [Actinokineospora sp.]|uniref:diiron oxygenase n=1 Tax=Actinokineospora sp. TaxID=1872133 RepID=UPI003D6C52EE